MPLDAMIYYGLYWYTLAPLSKRNFIKALLSVSLMHLFSVHLLSAQMIILIFRFGDERGIQHFSSLENFLFSQTKSSYCSVNFRFLSLSL